MNVQELAVDRVRTRRSDPEVVSTNLRSVATISNTEESAHLSVDSATVLYVVVIW